MEAEPPEGGGESDSDVPPQAEAPENSRQGKLISPGLHKEYVHRDSDYCPFPNFTQAMLSVLFRKHKFTKAFYNDLVILLRHPSFLAGDVFGSYDTLVRSQTGLPLLPYREYQVACPPRCRKIHHTQPDLFISCRFRPQASRGRMKPSS